MDLPYRRVIAAAPVARSGARAHRAADYDQAETSAVAWVFAKPAATAASIIAVSLTIRLVLMSTIGFGNDEAYTLAGARTLQLSYFDHPPLHIWLAHLASLMFGETHWVRLPFVLLFAVTGWLLFLVTRHLYGPRAAVWSVLALNLSIFFTVSAGGWVVPDGILILCLLAAVQRCCRSSCRAKAPGMRRYGARGLWRVSGSVWQACRNTTRF